MDRRLIRKQKILQGGQDRIKTILASQDGDTDDGKVCESAPIEDGYVKCSQSSLVHSTKIPTSVPVFPQCIDEYASFGEREYQVRDDNHASSSTVAGQESEKTTKKMQILWVECKWHTLMLMAIAMVVSLILVSVLPSNLQNVLIPFAIYELFVFTFFDLPSAAVARILSSALQIIGINPSIIYSLFSFFKIVYHLSQDLLLYLFVFILVQYIHVSNFSMEDGAHAEL